MRVLVRGGREGSHFLWRGILGLRLSQGKVQPSISDVCMGVAMGNKTRVVDLSWLV